MIRNRDTDSLEMGRGSENGGDEREGRERESKKDQDVMYI